MDSSETVLVYRIEHQETNQGPFQTPDPFLQKIAAFLSMPSNLRQFPSPWDDGIVLSAVPWWWTFGSTSLDKLMLWVSPGSTLEENESIYKTLQEKGFVIRKFLVEASSCRESRSGMQVIFDAESPRQDGLFEEISFEDYIRHEGVRLNSFGHLSFSTFEPKQLDYA